MSYAIIDHSVSFYNQTIQRASIFLRTIAEEIVSVSQDKTPKDTGRLRADVIKSVLGLSGKIRWQKKYAVYQEEKQFRHYTTAGTGPHFARDAVNLVVKQSDGIARKVGLI